MCRTDRGPARIASRAWSRNLVAILIAMELGAPVPCTSLAEDDASPDVSVLRATLASLMRDHQKYFVMASQPRGLAFEREWLASHLVAAGKQEALPHLDQLLADYEARSSKGELPKDLGSLNIKVVDAQFLTRMFSGDVLGGWKRFWAEFPDAAALLDVSLPGYSPDQEWAVVCYSVSRGSLAVEVWIALLRRQAGAWHVYFREILVQS